jgi:hypothetical protein
VGQGGAAAAAAPDHLEVTAKRQLPPPAERQEVAVKACDTALPPEEDFEYGEDFKHKNKGGGQQQQQQQQHGGGRKGMAPGEPATRLCWVGGQQRASWVQPLLLLTYRRGLRMLAAACQTPL